MTGSKMRETSGSFARAQDDMDEISAWLCAWGPIEAAIFMTVILRSAATKDLLLHSFGKQITYARHDGDSIG